MSVGLDKKQSHYAQEIYRHPEEWQIEEQLISDNLLRRQLSDFQKVAVSEYLYDIEKERAKQRLDEHRKTHDHGGKFSTMVKEDKGKSRDKVAEKIGISGRQLDKARKVYHEASEPKLYNVRHRTKPLIFHVAK